uniref:Solute carrier family 25 member 38 homolog n=1 Tax=Arcella intermedia TaxID=1963864 RepID=A0A6B2LCC3_9EUKA
MGGLASCVVFQPMDLIKTRLQQESHLGKSKRFFKTTMGIINEEGVRALWRGTIPTIYRNIPGHGLYFTAMEEIRYLLHALSRNSDPPAHAPGRPNKEIYAHWHNMAAGSLARGFVGTVLLPFTVVKTRFESRNMYNYKGVFNALLSIARNEGRKGLFSGLVPTLIRDMPYAGIQVTMYENNRKILKRTSLSETTVNFSASLFAGLMATLITQPVDVIKTRAQLDPVTYSRFFSSGLLILKKEGIFGFFRGSLPRVMRKACSSAVTWSMYEKISLLIHKHTLKSH